MNDSKAIMYLVPADVADTYELCQTEDGPAFDWYYNPFQARKGIAAYAKHLGWMTGEILTIVNCTDLPDSKLRSSAAVVYFKKPNEVTP